MQVIAIDTGGTKIAGALVDSAGNILQKVQFPNEGRCGTFIMNTYRRIIEELGKNGGYDAVGIGAGGRIAAQTGKVLYAVDIYQDYIGLEIKKTLEMEFQKPVFVTNDCRAALLGEVWQGGACGYEKVLALILGTGVGGGFLYNGELLDGNKGGLGEFGHMILHPGGHLCKCGQKGCVEQYLSGTALWHNYNTLQNEEQIHSGYEFFRLLEEGNSAAARVLENFTEDLAVCLVNLANAFDPDAILLGGGLIDVHSFWWDEMQKKFRSYGNIHVKSLPLLAARNGNGAALIGAAKFAFDGLSRL